jgi:hypothetical protein
MSRLAKRVQGMYAKTHTYISNKSLRLARARFEDRLANTTPTVNYGKNLQLDRDLDLQFRNAKTESERVALTEKYQTLIKEEPTIWHTFMAASLNEVIDQFPDGGTIINGGPDEWIRKAVIDARKWAKEKS